MGLDDEMEKLRQAEQWLREKPTAIHREAAMDYIKDRLFNTRREEIRTKAFYLLQEADILNGDA